MTTQLRRWCDQAALCVALLAVCIVVPILDWLQDRRDEQEELLP